MCMLVASVGCSDAWGYPLHPLAACHRLEVAQYCLTLLLRAHALWAWWCRTGDLARAVEGEARALVEDALSAACACLRHNARAHAALAAALEEAERLEGPELVRRLADVAAPPELAAFVLGERGALPDGTLPGTLSLPGECGDDGRRLPEPEGAGALELGGPARGAGDAGLLGGAGGLGGGIEGPGGGNHVASFAR